MADWVKRSFSILEWKVSSPGNPPEAAPGARPQAFWLLALREDSPVMAGPAAHKGLLARLSLRNYLKLFDALVAQAKVSPHLPGDAPGRAQAPQTPAWTSAVEAMLSGMGLGAAGFEKQWQRLATLRG